ncbi:MAG: NAD-dependent epimerase/dehydratase family protein [Actinobacteria bacterium]|nr:NAD-dependent epimerase/dehydratase family protein [Actinomycetota bacterium]MCB8996918.1 NAD-dependent epimerase/dehydratase family protein [Actinomycetota bacterium]MCB9414088.1 NAD-dependent epimerase/dehydratase family protein [Actinomycetota bacterium]
MRYALTGATGFVGSHLARQLREAGHEVVAVVRTPSKATGLVALGVEVVPGDVTSRSSLVDAFSGADGVFHVAGWYHLGSDHPEQGWAVNVQGTRNALDAAQEVGAPRVVYTSTIAVNSDTGGEVRDETYRYTGEHLSVYDHTKAQAHVIAEEYAGRGLDVVTVMPGGIYGPGDTSQIGELIRQAAHGRRVMAPAGLQMCMAHVDDVAHGHVLAMEKGRAGESYMLAGPQTTLVDVLRITAEIAGGKPPVVLPDVAVGASERMMGLLEKVAPVPSTYRAESLRASRASYLGTPAKAQAELGWFARALRIGLAETVEDELRG